MNSRRTFLKQSALLGASVAFLPSCATMLSKSNKPIGLQLYSLRDVIGKDVKGVINKIAQIGYKDVETYGYSKKSGFWGLDAKSFGDLLKQNGLKSPSGHFDLNNFLQSKNTDQLKEYIEAANILNSEYITVPSLPGSLTRNADSYKKVAEKLNEAALICKAAGLKIAYHNHNAEFKKFGNSTGYEILLKETDKNLVDFEMDLYWVDRSGQDVVKIFNAHPGRFKLWHIKDMDKTNKDLNAEVGNGSINFKSIFAASKLAGVKHLIVEHETNYKPTIMGSLETSFNYINKQLL